jgi:multiple sugar transport system permease protein
VTALAAPPTETRKGGPRRAPGAQFLQRGLPTLFMTVFLIYFLLPLAWLIVASTKNNEQLLTTFGLGFDHFNFINNLHQLVTLDGGEYLTWLRNTALYAVVSSGGAAMLCALAGYGFAKFHFRGKEALFWLVLGAVMVPQTALAIPTYLMFAKVNLTNGPFSVILPSLVSPFGIYLMRVYAEGAVPDTVLEAARSDGAGELRIFFQIAFRLLAPGFVTVLLFTFVQTWNNYFLPLVMLANPKWFPVTQGLAIWNGQATAGGGSQVLFSVVITGALIAIIPLILAFVVLQRYWQSGLATGGVKG